MADYLKCFGKVLQKINNIDEIVFWNYLDSPPKVYDEFEIKFKWGKSLNRSKIDIIMQSIGISPEYALGDGSIVGESCN